MKRYIKSAVTFTKDDRWYDALTTPRQEDLEQYIYDPSAKVRAGVAANPSTSEELLIKLYCGEHKFGSPTVYKALVNNPNTPENVRQLAAAACSFKDTHKDPPKTDWDLVKDPTTPLEVLQRLATDPSKRMRIAVTKHRNISKELLKQLCNDPDGEVRFYAKDAYKFKQKYMGWD